MKETDSERPRSRGETLEEQIRQLPDAPGVYFFRDGDGEILYIGKSISIRKRVRSHFSQKEGRNAREMIPRIETIEVLVCDTEGEALLAEQSFIRQHRPRFNICLRDDKSYPYIAVSLDEEWPRVYATRERHKPQRTYFGPFSSGRRVREVLDLLGKLFQYRTCDGPAPGRSSGSPCLDYYIKRCSAPCVDKISREEYVANIRRVVEFLSGRYREVSSQVEAEMKEASGAQDFERAAVLRDRLEAIASLMERQRVAGSTLPSADLVAVAIEPDSEDANAQVFQVRDGFLSERQSFFLSSGESEAETVAEEFLLQYYAATPAIPSLIVVGPELRGRTTVLEEALGAERDQGLEIRVAERGDLRKLREMAQRNAELALGQKMLRRQMRHRERAEALSELQEALGMERLPMRIEGFDVSNLGETHTVAAMVVFEGGIPKKSDYRKFAVRFDRAGGSGATGGRIDDFAAMREVVGRRVSRHLSDDDQPSSFAEPDESFSTLPDLIIIDGGKGQLSAAMTELSEVVSDEGVTVIGLAKRLEEVFVPGRSDPILLDQDSEALHLLQRVRDEAHRFAVSFHRQRRDRAMTTSALDGIPGVGPARKKALIDHFGTPAGVMEASREELEAVPGVPGKLAREIHRQLHRA